jgi:hypothetical protein
MDQTEDITESHDMINECSPEQWSSFEEAIKDMHSQDLVEIADRMGITGLTEDSLWQDFCKAFSDYEWYQFCDAFSRVMGRDFELS